MHLPNGSKIFIESSFESETEVVGADTTPPAGNTPANSFVLLFKTPTDTDLYKINDIVMITRSDRYGFLTGKLYRV